MGRKRIWDRILVDRENSEVYFNGERVMDRQIEEWLNTLVADLRAQREGGMKG
ncbi:MAG: hypothetical protein JRE40_04625 [Deltaproteobacteria bacterium]|nr:hypothetical protein [Deltaproteobacteria bacterium]